MFWDSALDVCSNFTYKNSTAKTSMTKWENNSENPTNTPD